MRSVVAIVGVLAAPALACIVSTSGLAGPPLGPDAAPDVVGIAESGPDTDVPDAADAGAYCDQYPAATFCADFDHDLNPASGFTGQLTMGNNSFSLSGDAISAPHSLVAEVGPSPMGQASARLYRDLGFIANKVHVELDAKLCDPSSGGLELVKIETSSAGLHDVNIGYEGADVALGMLGGASAISIEYYDPGGDQSKGYPLIGTLAIGTWIHVALDVVFSTDFTGSVTLFLDHSATPSETNTNVRTLSASASAMRVIVGVYSYNQPNDCTSLVDNVLVEAQ